MGGVIDKVSGDNGPFTIKIPNSALSTPCSLASGLVCKTNVTHSQLISMGSVIINSNIKYSSNHLSSTCQKEN